MAGEKGGHKVWMSVPVGGGGGTGPDALHTCTSWCA